MCEHLRTATSGLIHLVSFKTIGRLGLRSLKEDFPPTMVNTSPNNVIVVCSRRRNPLRILMPRVLQICVEKRGAKAEREKGKGHSNPHGTISLEVVWAPDRLRRDVLIGNLPELAGSRLTICPCSRGAFSGRQRSVQCPSTFLTIRRWSSI